MQKNKKMLRFFGLLVGLATLVVVWLVVVKPITNTKKDEIAVNTESNDENNSSLDGAVVGDKNNNNSATEKPQGGTSSQTPDSDLPNVAARPEAGDLPDELTTTGPETSAIRIISLIGVLATVYLVVLNRRLGRDAKSLTYLQR